jgi:serine/threonine protein kinase
MRSELGEGAFATTLRMKGKAGMVLEGRMFAVKHISLKKLKKHGMDFGSVRSEIDTLKNLKHVNIISYHSDYRTVHGSDEHVCIVMELASGGSLAEIINSKQPTERITRIMYEIASALNYVHSQGTIHRDIKPENILISSKGVVKIADFGLACEISESMASGACTRVGSDRYFSPEKAKGDSYDGKDDVWAAGCILLELCAGARIRRPLWSDSQETTKCREMLIGEVAQVSGFLEVIARNMLTLSKSERWKAVQVECNLDPALGRTPDPPRPRSRPQPLQVLASNVLCAAYHSKRVKACIFMCTCCVICT